jgi:hypothetical protein
MAAIIKTDAHRRRGALGGRDLRIIMVSRRFTELPPEKYGTSSRALP